MSVTIPHGFGFLIFFYLAEAMPVFMLHGFLSLSFSLPVSCLSGPKDHLLVPVVPVDVHGVLVDADLLRVCAGVPAGDAGILAGVLARVLTLEYVLFTRHSGEPQVQPDI